MLIDWFTVGAQIANFLILVWLLKRFLYRPVLAAIDTRDKDIATRKADALAAQEQARKDREACWLQKKNLEDQRAALINAAQEDAKKERIRLLQDATREADNLVLARRKELEEETKNYRDELVRLVRQEIVATVRRVLSDLASAELEHFAVEVFLRRIGESSVLKEVKGDGNAAPSIRLRSAFPLAPAQQETIRQEIQKKFPKDDHIDFETAPDLGLGLELIVQDQKITWSIDGYLSSFETRLAEFAEKKSQPISS